MTTVEDAYNIRLSMSIALKSENHLQFHIPAYISGAVKARVGFFPSKTCSFRTKWKKLDKTCFDQFLPSKTVQNRPKLDEIMNSLVKMVISLN